MAPAFKKKDSTMSSKNRLMGNRKVVQALAPINPSTSTPDYVSLKGFQHASVIINIDNGTATGGAITLLQATAVAGTGEKALAFATVYKNEDTSASDTMVETAVVSDTFTPSSVNDDNLQYVIEIDASSLDVDGGFDCFRVGTADATAAVTGVTYVLSGTRYAEDVIPSAITD